MNKKTLFAILAGFVVSMLLGWLVWGMLLKNTMTTGTMTGLNKPEADFNWAALCAGDLCYVILFTMLLNRMGVSGVKGGFMNALWIGFLITLFYDLVFLGTTNMYNNIETICINVVASAIAAGI